MAQQGLQQRHRSGCSGKGRCDCPWRASVYSAADERQIKRTFPSKAAALAWREDSRGAVRRRELRAPTGETLKQAADAFQKAASEGLARPRSGAEYKPATLRAFEQHLRLRVLPALGARKLASIDRVSLQDFIDRLLADGASPALIEASCTPLRAIFARAVDRNQLTINPCLGLRLPAERKRRERVAPPAECRALLDALRDSDRALWATLMYAGLRRGEAQALRIEDIDLPGGAIHVRASWDQYCGRGETKSGKDRRVPIAAELRRHLAAHLLALDWSEGLAFGVSATRPFVPTGIAFRADIDWRNAGLGRITPHECRHTYASLMIAAGVGPVAIASYMGHADVRVTLNVYAHLFNTAEAESAAALDAYLSSAASA
ncbi:MAG TPA: tyrosine-type recombinase/integrase [Solirubrobacteraceae bacterium]|nr:tyrosine-type recombinase/integrase [Solirubrobacteraceae bacterium]